MICLTFEHSPVFRVGGDEFVVLLKGYDYVHIEQLAGKFNEEIDRVAGDNDLKSWERISAALGYALYDPDRDRSIEDTFARADRAMYNKKKNMKASRK
jgi:diguanylate cyclase (GGDEF)-like protein